MISMGMFGSYIKTLAYFMIFTAMVEILSPFGSFKKFIRLVMSLILIALILEPFGALLNNSNLESNYFRLRNSMDNLLLSGERERYEQKQAEMIIEEYKRGLDETTVQVIEKRTGYTVKSAGVVVNEDYGSEDYAEILGVHVTVSIPGVKNKDSTLKKTLLGNANGKTPFNAEEEAVISIKNCLTDFYNVQEDNIHITVRSE